MSLEVAILHGTDMQHTPCSSVYYGMLDYEGAYVCCGAVS
jgi:hypothetical protein